jgi:hypothetical protein
MSPETLQALLPIAGFIAAILAVLSVTIYAQVLSQAEPQKYMFPNAGAGVDIQHRMNTDARQFVQNHGCVYLGGWSFQSVSVAAWQVPKTQTRLYAYYASHMVSGQPLWEFATSFGPGRSLTTTGGRTGQMYWCSPGCFKESIPLKSMEQLYDSHQKSLALLRSTINLDEQPETRTVDQVLCDALRNDVKTARRRLFWPLRLLFRLFFNKHRMYGKTIEDQLRRGMIEGISTGGRYTAS